MSYGINAPQGLVPISTLAGAATNFAQPFAIMQIASAYGTNLFTGDPVGPNSTANGTIGIAVVGASTSSIPAMGVFNGCVYTGTNGIINLGAGPAGQSWWAANTILATGTIAQANIIGLDPHTLYTIQTNSSNGVPITSNFSNANFAVGTGNTQTGVSGYALDQSTINLNSYLNLRIWGVDQTGGLNDWSNGFGSLPYNNVIVSINNHFASVGVSGV